MLKNGWKLIPLCLLMIILWGHWHIHQTRGAGTSVISTSFLTYEERCLGPVGEITRCRELEGLLEVGDILVTASAHTLFFRHGHAGAVVDTEKGLVLEVLGLGEVSAFLPLNRWEYFPTLMILRPNPPFRGDIKKEAQKLSGLSYFPFASRDSQGWVQCATLIWRLFDNLGVGLDMEGLILPLRLAESPNLSLVYSDGFN
ncbi:MAG: hypothetical protein FWF59_05030 [Turicibacter sp.]|nr:hypothetical protein [Turicibacter sp.]